MTGTESKRRITVPPLMRVAFGPSTSFGDRMATLLDRIKQAGRVVKRGSQLFEGAPESLAQQVNRQGLLPGAAVSPEAAASMGVTADQAKMAGSSAQLQRAVRESIAPERLIKEPQARTIGSAAEKEAAAKGERLAGLESLGSRISGLVKNYIASADIQAAKPKFLPDKLKNDYPSMTPEQAAKVQAAVETGTVDPELFTLFNVTVGTEPDAAKKASDSLLAGLGKYTEAAKDTAIASIQAGLGPNVTLAQMKPDDFAALGLQGLGDLASLLGESEDTLRTMTIDELQARVNRLTEDDFDRVEELQRIANDAFYPENVRRQAQLELRELSSVGVVATEADFNKLNQQVQSADIITLGGKEYTVAGLLSDEGISGVIKAYLDDKDGSYKKLLEAELPELVQFIKANEAALKTASDKLASSATGLASIQQSNAKLGSYENTSLQDFNAAIYPEYDPKKPSATALAQTSAHGILFDDKNGLDVTSQKQPYAAFLNYLGREDKEAAKQFANYSLPELNDLIAAAGFGTNWKAFFDSFQSKQEGIKALNNSTIPAAAAVDRAFGGNGNGDEINKLSSELRNAYLMQELNIGAPLSGEATTLIGLLDVSPRDGQVDSMDAIRENIKRYYGDKVDFGKVTLSSLFDKLRSDVIARTSDQLYKAVQDGTLSKEEVTALVTSDTGVTPAKLYDLLRTKGSLVKADEAASAETRRLLEEAASKSMTEAGISPDILDYEKLYARFKNPQVAPNIQKMSRYFTEGEFVRGGFGTKEEYNGTRDVNKLFSQFRDMLLYEAQAKKLVDLMSKQTNPVAVEQLSAAQRNLKKIQDELKIYQKYGTSAQFLKDLTATYPDLEKIVAQRFKEVLSSPKPPQSSGLGGAQASRQRLQ